MARDHALATEAAPGGGCVRFYRWRPATLSLGRNEPLTDAYLAFLRAHAGIGLVRRPTGGRAVLHDRELTYAAVLPARTFGGARAAYRRINEGLVAGLRALGVDADAADGRALPPGAGPCFLEPADGEVAVAGRKLVGSAQVRIGDALLQHGSLLLESDQSGLFAAAAGSAGAAPTPPVTLSEALGEVPPWKRLVASLADGLASALGGRWTRESMTPRERALAAGYEVRYRSRAWTRRR